MEQYLRTYVWSTKQEPERGNETCPGQWALETSKLTPNNTPPPARSHFLVFLKQSSTCKASIQIYEPTGDILTHTTAVVSLEVTVDLFLAFRGPSKLISIKVVLVCILTAVNESSPFPVSTPVFVVTSQDILMKKFCLNTTD